MKRTHVVYLKWLLLTVQNKGYHLRAPKFRSRDEGSLYKRLQKKTEDYLSRHGNKGKQLLAFKSVTFLAIAVAGYSGIFLANGFVPLLLCYVCFGGGLVLLGINIGHDAAHDCVTGNRKTDQRLFRFIFGIQGLNGYLWEIRHNHSHHPFPNVPGYDCDLETSELFCLSPDAEKKWFHRYQHLYAPVVYSLFSLISAYYLDLKMFFRKRLGNIIFTPSPRDWMGLWGYKVLHLAIYVMIPAFFTSATGPQILLTYLCMHLILSFVISFVFFVSHHVEETEYVTTDQNQVQHSWLETQVRATLDFHAGSRLAGFFFGGFNAHLAHHLFPSVSHVHYPALTAIIREELVEAGLKYNSSGFFPAVVSHLRHLKKAGQ